MNNNDKFLSWLRKSWLAILILGVLITVITVYARLPQDVQANTKRSIENKEAIIRMETHYEHIQEKQNSQDAKLDKILERLPPK